MLLLWCEKCAKLDPRETVTDCPECKGFRIEVDSFWCWQQRGWSVLKDEKSYIRCGNIALFTSEQVAPRSRIRPVVQGQLRQQAVTTTGPAAKKLVQQPPKKKLPDLDELPFDN